MIPILAYPSNEAQSRLEEITQRGFAATREQEETVREMIEAVRLRGDEALVEYTRRFDAPRFTTRMLTVTEDEKESAYGSVDGSFMEILRQARENIEGFHRHQLPSSWFVTRKDGTILGQVVHPVASAGLYIPGAQGGETPLISTVLMAAVPARLAGVGDIAMVTPPRSDGSINPHLLVAAQEAGVSRVHKVGSAWAVAALAYGTASIDPVDVIVGPGNIYVTLAKKIVSGDVGIDLLAGPSEILVVADETADPIYVASDLLSQAEHDPMASAVCVTHDRDLGPKVLEAMERQMERLSRRETAKEALKRYGAIFLTQDLGRSLELANLIAPEHLELLIRDPWAAIPRVHNAGAVFLGPDTPEPVGDYFAGPNHVLPTAGTARFASALGVENFIKKTSLVSYSRSALQRDADAIMALARLEGLEAHAASVEVRVRP